MSIASATSFKPPVASLFVPGDRPERFDKAAASGADAIILDLEDAVAPANKQAARHHVRDWLAANLGKVSAIVRINSRESEWFSDDLVALAGLNIAAIMVPKTQSRQDITGVQAVLGIDVPIVALIESAAAYVHLYEILSTDGVACAAFGSIDFALDLGCSSTWEPLLYARSELVLRCRQAGLPAPIDGVTTTFDDPSVVAAESRRALEMGFSGKLAIHPKQVDAIKQGFAPDEATLAWARKVIAASGDGSATKMDGAMLDLPMVERAKRILKNYPG